MPSYTFHLALPTHDLAKTEHFYTTVLGARLGRRTSDRVSLTLFGAQLVFHLSPEHVDREATVYPRHFGATFASAQEFDSWVSRLEPRVRPLGGGVSRRFSGTAYAHRTFLFADPSNNVVELKHYDDPAVLP